MRTLLLIFTLAFSCHAQMLPSIVAGNQTVPACSTAADEATGTFNSPSLIGYSAAAYKHGGNSFVAGSTYTLCKVTLPMAKNGSPTFDVSVCIYSESGGKPSAQVGTCSGAVAASTFVAYGGTPLYNPITFTGMSANLTSGTTYFVVLSPSAVGDSNNYASMGVGVGTVPNYYSPDLSTWTQYYANRVTFLKSYK